MPKSPALLNEDLKDVIVAFPICYHGFNLVSGIEASSLSKSLVDVITCERVPMSRYASDGRIDVATIEL